MFILKYLLAGILGAIFGSFLNVVIYRLPLQLNLFTPRSHCPKCKHKISWWHNIPILSFLILRGHCNNCFSKIKWRYFFVEIISSIVTILILAKTHENYLAFSSEIFFTYCLIILFCIDLEEYILPDEITLGLMWIGLLLNPSREFILGAVFGYLMLWLIGKIFLLIRKTDGIGNGDFKLLAALGAWLGFTKLPLLLFFAALIGSILGIALLIGKKLNYHQAIPFGPFLITIGWILLIFNKAPVMLN